MKTSKSVSRPFTSAITCFMLIVITALFFTSCKKEESATPAQSNNAEASAKLISLPPVEMVFSSIKINHYAANTSLPDYDVIVFSNGSAVYEGRKNVKTKGTRKFEISQDILKRINNLSIQFMSISTPANPASDAQKAEAQSMTETTFTATGHSDGKLFRDYNNGQPVWLVTFRTEVEKAMNISSLIKITDRFQNLPD